MQTIDLAALVAILAPLAIVVHWLTDAAKDVTNRDWNAVLTRVLAFVGSFGLVSLAAHSSINLGDGTAALHTLGWSDQLLIGWFGAATAGSVIQKAITTFNNADPTVSKMLIPPSLPNSLDQAAVDTANEG